MWPFDKLIELSRRVTALEAAAPQLEASIHMTAIGSVTITWAIVEIALDQCNAIILHGHGGSVLDKDMPVSLSRKISFFRKAHNHLSVLALHKEAALELADRVTALKDKRHDLVHGIAMTTLADGSRSIRRHTYKGAHLDSVSTNYSDIEIFAVADKAADLAADILAYGKLLSLSAKNKRNNAG